MNNAGFCSRPMQDIPPSGDGWYIFSHQTVTRVMLADGLGHGVNAQRVVLHLIKQMSWLCERSNVLPGINECMIKLDQCLRKLNDHSAQAAVAIADINTSDCTITAAGIGNIETLYICDGKTHRFHSCNGMIGGRMPSKLPIQHHEARHGSLVGMFSDGLSIKTAQNYLCRISEGSTSLQKTAAQNIANQVVELSRSRNDDASCAVVVI